MLPELSDKAPDETLYFDHLKKITDGNQQKEF